MFSDFSFDADFCKAMATTKVRAKPSDDDIEGIMISQAEESIGVLRGH
jgi:hypothetical protein